MVAPGGHVWLLWGACMVAPGGGMRGCSGGGACMVALGGVRGCSGGVCAWLLPGGACMVAPGGPCMAAPGGHAWLLWGGVRGCSGGACVVALGGGVRGFFDEIRSMSGRYASYWNAFLFPRFFSKYRIRRCSLKNATSVII